MLLYQKSTNTNKETEETMKVLETDKSIADNKIDKVCQKKDINQRRIQILHLKKKGKLLKN